jgi:hypothetical protein
MLRKIRPTAWSCWFSASFGEQERRDHEYEEGRHDM